MRQLPSRHALQHSVGMLDGVHMPIVLLDHVGGSTHLLRKKIYIYTFLHLLTVDMTTLGDGQGTRYRAELNVKLPALDDMTPDDVKKTIDTVITDPATASAVESKTVKLEMSPDEVKKTLGNPDKIVDLGQKQIYIYKDMKITFIDAKVTDVQ
jgi:hypothetical protein